jgi:glycosyltransferase involved in cell wall biosynthesis
VDGDGDLVPPAREPLSELEHQPDAAATAGLAANVVVEERDSQEPASILPVRAGWTAYHPDSLHIGLNLVFLVPGYTGGTEVYARELIPELVAAAPGTRFTAFVNREAAAATDAPWGELIPAVTVPVRARNRVEWARGEQQLLPRLASHAGVDLIHSLANTAPLWGRFRRVTTIHDLSHRMAADAHRGLLGPGMRVLVSLSARRSHRIIVDAASTRGDLHRLLKVPESKIDVVPLGLGSRARIAPMPEAQLRAMLRAGDRPIALCVAAKRPHKNLLRLLGALALIPAGHRPVLALPGYPTPHEKQLRSRIAELSIDDDVRLLDWVQDSELEGLYAAAACFVFPSLLEGFGLPVLEAMARGVPVACSGRGALGEVAGDAALRFDPESEPAIAAAIERLIADRAEADRLRVAGRKRAAEFSWAATAAGTLASYERTLSAAL